MTLLWALISGALFVPFGFFETGRWFFSFLWEQPEGYPSVEDIWIDRSIPELFCYVFGQLLFLGWPFLLVIVDIGPRESCRTVATIQWFAFILLAFLTLGGPIGMRRRYRRLTASHSTGYERLFVGLVPATMFLKTSGTGTYVLMREFLAIVIILITGPALVNYATWLDLEKQAYNIPSEVQAADIGLPDFIYQSVVTITTGSGYISPNPSLSVLQIN